MQAQTPEQNIYFAATHMDQDTDCTSAWNLYISKERNKIERIITTMVANHLSTPHVAAGT